MFNTLPANPFPPSSEQMGAGGGGGSYVLPVASADTLGGVKVGEGLEINAETGVLNNTNPTPPTPYTPPAYSTTEQATGRKWIDNSDIYEKVLVLESAMTINANAWGSDIDFVGDKIISVSAINSTDNNVFPVGANIASNKLSLLNPRNSAVTIDVVIVEYTKIESEVN